MQSIRKITHSLFSSSKKLSNQVHPQQQEQQQPQLKLNEERELMVAIEKSSPAVGTVERTQTIALANVGKHEDLVERVQSMKLENERLQLDVARLEQQLAAVSIDMRHSQNMRLTIEALQTQIRMLVGEMNKRGGNSKRRFSAGDINVEMHNQFVMNLQSQLEEGINRLVVGGEVKPVWNVILNARRELNTKDKMTQTVGGAQMMYVPKRIMYRPSRIMIPMVRIHDARMQEIELLRGVTATRKPQAQR